MPNAVNSGGTGYLILRLTTALDPLAEAGETLTSRFSIEGGGAEPASTLDPALVAVSTPAFGIDAFDGLIANPDGSAFAQAAGHPDSVTTHIDLNTYRNPAPSRGDFYPVEPVRDFVADLPPGLVGNPTTGDRCTLGQLSHGINQGELPLCPAESQVGTTLIRFHGQPNFADTYGPLPVFNMVPPPASPARFGFYVLGVPSSSSTLPCARRPPVDRPVRATSPEALALAGTSLAFWGAPSAASHTAERACPGEAVARSCGRSPPAPAPPPKRPSCACPPPAPQPAKGSPRPPTPTLTTTPAPSRRTATPDLSDPNWKSASFESHLSTGAAPARPGRPDPGLWGTHRCPTGCLEVPVEGLPQRRSRPPIDTETPSGLQVERSRFPEPGAREPNRAFPLVRLQEGQASPCRRASTRQPPPRPQGLARSAIPPPSTRARSRAV